METHEPATAVPTTGFPGVLINDNAPPGYVVPPVLPEPGSDNIPSSVDVAPVDEHTKRILATNATAPVVVWSKSYCGYCDRVLRQLAILEPRFACKVTQLDKDPTGHDVQAALIKLTSCLTVPQVFVGGEFIGGCTETIALQNKGGLQPLIAKAVDELACDAAASKAGGASMVAGSVTSAATDGGAASASVESTVVSSAKTNASGGVVRSMSGGDEPPSKTPKMDSVAGAAVDVDTAGECTEISTGGDVDMSTGPELAKEENGDDATPIATADMETITPADAQK